MIKEAFYDMSPGTKLLAGNKFVDGIDPDVQPYFGKIITFDYFKNDKWVYFQELPHAPFHYDEIECIVGDLFHDDDTQYETGDMSLIFGEVCS